MKQKYLVAKDDAEGVIFIREYAALETGDYVFVCEERYDIGVLSESLGDENLIRVLSRPNMYPRHDIGGRIAGSVRQLLTQVTPEASCLEVLVDEPYPFLDLEHALASEIIAGEY